MVASRRCESTRRNTYIDRELNKVLLKEVVQAKSEKYMRDFKARNIGKIQ